MLISGTMVDLSGNLDRVRERLALALQRAGRPPDSLTLMAVSKFQPLEAIAGLYSLGQRLFGENRVQEGLAKKAVLPPDLRLELIGHLQSNKARDAAGFDGLQSLDSLKVAVKLAQAAAGAPKPMPVLLEVCTSPETTKYGVRSFEDLQALAETCAVHSSLDLQGLMTIATLTEDREEWRRCFRQLRHWRDRLETVLRRPLPVLSMGMSMDLEIAVEEGSTLVRVGTALFGARP